MLRAFVASLLLLRLLLLPGDGKQARGFRRYQAAVLTDDNVFDLMRRQLYS